MTTPVAASLKSRLVRRLLPLQAALLVVLVLLIIATLWVSGFRLHQRDEARVIDVLKDAVTRDSNAGLVLRPTRALQELRSDSPGLWFLIRDRTGQTLSEGEVPSEFVHIGGALDAIGQAKLGWDRTDDKWHRPSAQMKRVETSAGDLQIIATTDAKISDVKSLGQLVLVSSALTLPAFILMTLATLMATPRVVRNALGSLDEVAHQAEKIDIEKRGARLPVGNVPIEIAPLVTAVNDALGRLDRGYEQHRRFLADAAHELRTPIAILTTRLEALPEGPAKHRLMEDVARLATLTEQLLDLQRLEQHLVEFSAVDLVDLCAQVTADLAPMAIAAGYDISFQRAAERIEIRGDRSSLERAVVNLVQNAVQHGGRGGGIVVAVRLPATIAVSDQGPGIPPAQRDMIFEPFHRLRPLSRGAGLGLNLVREITHLHGGEVTITDGPCGGGACFQIALPPMDTLAEAAQPAP